MNLKGASTQDLIMELLSRPKVMGIDCDADKNYFVASGIHQDGDAQEDSIPGEGPATIIIVRTGGGLNAKD